MKVNRFLWFFLLMGVMACSSAKDEEPKESYAASRAWKLKTERVRKVSVPVVRSFPGTVASAETAFLVPKIVKKGDLLVKIRSKELVDKKKFAESAVKETENGESQAKIGLEMAGAALKQAEAQYTLAEKTYIRFKNLIETESVSKQEFDQVEAKYKAALEGRKIAKKNLGLSNEKLDQVKIKKQQALAMLDEVKTYLNYSQLKAPFDGIVLQKLMDVGNLVSPGHPILKTGTKKGVIYAQVNGSVMKDIRVGAEALVELPSADISYKARILEVSPDIDPATRNFRVKLSGGDGLIPGMYAKVFFGEGHKEVIVIPNSAVSERGQLRVIFVDKDKRAEMRIVKTGGSFKDGIEILSGVQVGEKIVVEKGENIKSGDLLED